MKANEIKNFDNMVKSLLPPATIEYRYASGGLLLEAVHNSFKPNDLTHWKRKIIDAQFEFNSKNALEERFSIHSIFLYEHQNSAYCVPGMLHTRPGDYDKDGIFTSYLNAEDAQVWIREIDSEALHLGIEKPLNVQLLSAYEKGSWSINPKAPYLEIAFEGTYWAIKDLTHIKDNFWQVTIL